jgi:hypothetical protein
MALALTERVHGRKLAESLQLVIDYDPQPPFTSGSPTTADASTLRLALRVLFGGPPGADGDAAQPSERSGATQPRSAGALRTTGEQAIPAADA